MVIKVSVDVKNVLCFIPTIGHTGRISSFTSYQLPSSTCESATKSLAWWITWPSWTMSTPKCCSILRNYHHSLIVQLIVRKIFCAQAVLEIGSYFWKAHLCSRYMTMTWHILHKNHDISTASYCTAMFSKRCIYWNFKGPTFLCFCSALHSDSWPEAVRLSSRHQSSIFPFFRYCLDFLLFIPKHKTCTNLITNVINLH